MSFSMIAGDLEPDMNLAAVVNGEPESLADGDIDTIELVWLKPDETRETVPLTAVSLADGYVKRVWAAGDTDDVGVHRGRILVTYDSGETKTYPNDGSWFFWWVYAA